MGGGTSSVKKHEQQEHPALFPSAMKDGPHSGDLKAAAPLSQMGSISDLQARIRQLEDAVEEASSKAQTEQIRADDVSKALEAAERLARDEKQRADEAEDKVRRLTDRITQLEARTPAADHTQAGEVDLALLEAAEQKADEAVRRADAAESKILHLTDHIVELEARSGVVLASNDMESMLRANAEDAGGGGDSTTDEGDVVWSCDVDGRLQPYDRADCEALEKARSALSSGPPSAPSTRPSRTRSVASAGALVQVRYGRNVVDVARMVQVNKQTKKERPVLRQTHAAPRQPTLSAAAFVKAVSTMQMSKDYASILRSMTELEDSSPAQEAGLKALASVAGGADQIKSKMVAAGVVEATLGAMRRFTEHEGVQEQSARLLRRLAHSASLGAMQIQGRIVQQGGVETLLETLQRMAGSAAVQEEALAVLRIIAADHASPHRGRLVHAGCIDAAVAAMARHEERPGVQAQGCGVLRFVAAGGGGAAGEKQAQRVRVQVAAAGGAARAEKARRAAGAQDDTKKWAKQLLEMLSGAEAVAAAAKRKEEEEERVARQAAVLGHCRRLCEILRQREEERRGQGEREGWRDGGDGGGPGRQSAGGGGGGAAGAGIGDEGETEDKYTARKLILKASTIAAAGLRPAIGLEDDKVLGNLMQDAETAIELEFLEHGSAEDKENFHYIYRGRAGEWSDMPAHVKQDIELGRYHGGELGPEDYDAGHKLRLDARVTAGPGAQGMRLDDFVAHPFAKMAKLRRQHVLVLRLYTSSTFARFNRPLRRLEASAGRGQHPFRFSVLVLAEALKMLRVVGAEMDPQGFNEVNFLYRGMADMQLDVAGRFLKEGGTELALMSTTKQREIALNYAKSRTPLVFKFKTLGLTRGCSIQFLSLYPKEDEYLYPPLTFVSAEGEPYVEDGITFLDVVPQMS